VKECQKSSKLLHIDLTQDPVRVSIPSHDTYDVPKQLCVRLWLLLMLAAWFVAASCMGMVAICCVRYFFVFYCTTLSPVLNLSVRALEYKPSVRVAVCVAGTQWS
jgi:hypothetical protein